MGCTSAPAVATLYRCMAVCIGLTAAPAAVGIVFPMVCRTWWKVAPDCHRRNAAPVAGSSARVLSGLAKRYPARLGNRQKQPSANVIYYSAWARHRWFIPRPSFLIRQRRAGLRWCRSIPRQPRWTASVRSMCAVARLRFYRSWWHAPGLPFERSYAACCAQGAKDALPKSLSRVCIPGCQGRRVLPA